MKILTIAMMVFLIQLSVVIVDVLDIYKFNIATQTSWVDEVESVENQQYLRSDVTTDVSTSFGFGDFIVGLRLFIDFIWRVLNISATFQLFGLDPVLSRFISAPVFILYGLGLAQFIGNRGTKGME